MNEIRISCTSLASIMIDDKYLLCFNKSQFKNGFKVLTPFGGAIEYTEDALPFFKNINANFERKTPDLRFTTSFDNLGLFETWFNKKLNREVGVDRELIEEMVDEEKIFTKLGRNEFKSIYINLIEDVDDYNNIINHRFYEVYEVSFTQSKINEIREKLKDSHIRLVSKEEVLNGVTYDGIEIGGNSKCILRK